MLLGPAKVAPREYMNLQCRLVDLDGELADRHIGPLRTELMSVPGGTAAVALRAGHRWAPDFASLTVPETGLVPSPLRDGGAYLVIGGLGGVGLSIAEHCCAPGRWLRIAMLSPSALRARSNSRSPDGCTCRIN